MEFVLDEEWLPCACRAWVHGNQLGRRAGLGQVCRVHRELRLVRCFHLSRICLCRLRLWCPVYRCATFTPPCYTTKHARVLVSRKLQISLRSRLGWPRLSIPQCRPFGWVIPPRVVDLYSRKLQLMAQPAVTEPPINGCKAPSDGAHGLLPL